MERCASTQPELYQVDDTQVRCLLHEDGTAEEKTA
jgi:hypothetical protein